MPAPASYILRANTKARAAKDYPFWRNTLQYLLTLRAGGVAVPNELLLRAYGNYCRNGHNHYHFRDRNKVISTTTFAGVFAALGDRECLEWFRFKRDDLLAMVPFVCDEPTTFRTGRNRYKTTPLLTTCIILARLASPFGWCRVETFFRQHSSHLSEMFWEWMDAFVAAKGYLILSPLSGSCIAENAARLAAAVYEKARAYPSCTGYVDGTVLAVARPGSDRMQNVVYNGHKRKHALKYQVVLTPEGMFLHVLWPDEGRRHDWTLWVRSELDAMLEETMVVDGVQYIIYGDSGYNSRAYMEVPFQGASIAEPERAFNKAMSAVRITVEWIFKEVKLYWSTVDYKRKLRILEAPVGSMCLTAMLLSNARNTFYPNQVAQYFNCYPPSLAQFLSCREDSITS